MGCCLLGMARIDSCTLDIWDDLHKVSRQLEVATGRGVGFFSGIGTDMLSVLLSRDLLL